NALQVYTKESLPQGWARTQNNLGAAYETLGERLGGTEAAEMLRAAVTAYQNALQVRTKASLPQDWATTQNNLGIAYEILGERLSGTKGAESLRAAVAAFQNALQVYTKESLPQGWAITQNNLARTLALQEEWEEAARATENVLSLYPKMIEGLVRAEGIYHNRLFRFDRAFELNARRVELGEGELDFIEKHLTTARFDACATRASALEPEISESDQRQVLTALRFACLSAAQKIADARAAGRQLRQQTAGLDKVRWTFTGTKHFASQHAAFAARSADWVRLFEAMEEGDEAKANAALTALGVPE
ncbi:MAG: tetratricopeptide repeat protein, partial [Acidobacteriia bacterium]|nr:tetratricopeptide repeat protein [Terriglobia bacterium]